MPKYKVTTDQGVFAVELDRPPSSAAELSSLVQQQISQPSPLGYNHPPGLGGQFKTAEEQMAAQEQALGQFKTAREINAPATGPDLSDPNAAQPAETRVFETINQPLDYVARKVVGEPVTQGLGAIGVPESIAGGAGTVAKEAAQFFMPGLAAKAATLPFKAAAKVGLEVPGLAGGRMEQAITSASRSLNAKKVRAEMLADDLRAKVAQIPDDAAVPLSNTQKALKELKAAEGRKFGKADSGFVSDIDAMLGSIESGANKAHPREVDAFLSEVGKKTKVVMGQAEPHEGYKRIFAALHKDLEGLDPQVTNVARATQPSLQKVGGESFITTQRSPQANMEIRQVPPGQPLVPLRRDTTVFDAKPTPSQPMSATPKPFMQETQRQGRTPETLIRSETPAGMQSTVTAPLAGAGETVALKRVAERRVKGFENIIDEFNSLVKTKRGSERAQDINANQLLDKLRNDEFLQKSLTKRDWDEITPIINKLADLPALPPGTGVQYGSGRALARGTLAGGVASLTGADPWVIGGVVTALDYGVGHLLMTQKGRKYVSAILDMPKVGVANKLNMINALGRMGENAFGGSNGGDR